MSEHDGIVTMLVERMNNTIDRVDVIFKKIENMDGTFTSHNTRIGKVEQRLDDADKPSKAGTWAQIGTAIVAVIAIIIAFFKNS